MSCWFCGNEMIWMSDNTFEEKEMFGDGVVSIFICSNEDCGCEASFSKEEKSS